MSLKILHSGDVHIGLKFNNYPEYIQKKLIEARYNVLENLVNKANKRKVNLLVIAGDLFDKHNIKEKNIIKTINKLKGFSGDAILILPGNHDFDNGGVELWEKFSNNMSGKMVLLNDFKKYALQKFDLDVTVYAAPCDSKHSDKNNLAWIKNKDINSNKDNNKYKLGIAHGALSGISPDMTDSYFKMYQEELNRIGLDLWLLGHTHLPYPFEDEVINRSIFNCGTPEPDGMDCSHSGNAWFIEINDKKEINAEQVETGYYRFYDLNYKVNSINDLEKIKKDLLKNEAKNKIVRLKLEGRIDEEIYNQKEEFYQKLKEKLAYLKVNDNDLKIKINAEIIADEYSENSFPYKMLTELKEDEKALQLAYEFMKEVRS